MACFKLFLICNEGDRVHFYLDLTDPTKQNPDHTAAQSKKKTSSVHVYYAEAGYFRTIALLR